MFKGVVMKLADRMDTQDVTVTHDAVPGRLRLRVRRLRASPGLGRGLERGLAGHDGIRRVRAGATTGSLLVTYDPVVPAEEIIERVRGLLAVPLPANDLLPAVPGEPWHCLPEPALYDRLGSRRGGLSTGEAGESLRRHGPNRVTPVPPRSGPAIFADQFRSLPVGMLAVAAGLSILTGGLADAAVILGVVMINAGIGTATELQSERTIRSLSTVTRPFARVLRDGAPSDVAAEAVVMGDILVLSQGGLVAADARVIEACDLTVNEALLTGESLPVGKTAGCLADAATPVADRSNMVYQGTVVTGGSGRALVVATGTHTEMAGIQALLEATEQPATPMQRQLHRMGNQLVWTSAAICAGVFGLGLMRGYGLIPMAQSAIALAVAALPEGLPTVATTTLALGVKDMRDHQVLVRRLAAVETLGAVNVICFDKTGTLTLNRMSVVSLATVTRMVEVVEGRFRDGGQPIQPRGDLDLRQLLRVVALCNEAELDDAGPRGSPTEVALVQAAQQAGIDVTELRRRQPLCELAPRTEHRPLMTSVHHAGDARLVAVKGSPEEVLALCRWCQVDGRLMPLDEARRAAIRTQNQDMAAAALRVLGVAFRKLAPGDEVEEEGLAWLGLVGMADPIRPGMPELMSRFHAAGIETAMITGDQPATAHAVARQLGLARVYARVGPSEKLRIVQALQRNGRVVAMTGDGVNDSPALRAADVGVAMGHGGTDVARDAADLILEDDRLETMAVAVARGRTIYRNIRKAIRYLLTTNMSEIQVMLAATALGLGPPLAPMQLLWINLVTDIFPGLALALEPPAPDVLRQRPRDPAEPILHRGSLGRMLAESTALSAGALAAYGWGMARYGSGGARAPTLAFHSLVSAQLLYAVSCRTERGGWAERRRRPANPWLTWALGGSFLAQGLLAATPGLRRLFGMAPMSLLDLGVVAAGGVLPVLAIEAARATRSAASRSSSGSGSNTAHRGPGRRRR
jgi:Ca2+-transporting ATPase